MRASSLRLISSGVASCLLVSVSKICVLRTGVEKRAKLRASLSSCMEGIDIAIIKLVLKNRLLY